MLDRLAASMADEPVESLAVLRSMLTHPGASDAAAEGAARYRAQLAELLRPCLRSLTGADG
ncbi:hypothetical protein ACFYYP_06495 [Microbispora rosea]|uniref:hypothetical protein n=1 Tax=Microbispora rosea TaxID=58117 RepID=UPI0036B8B63E